MGGTGVGDVLFERLLILTSENSTRCLLGIFLLYFMAKKISHFNHFLVLLCTHHHSASEELFDLQNGNPVPI